MTKNEWILLEPIVHAMLASGEPCGICGSKRDRVCTFTIITTKPAWRRVMITPLCKACAEDPEVKTKMLIKDFSDECVDIS